MFDNVSLLKTGTLIKVPVNNNVYRILQRNNYD